MTNQNSKLTPEQKQRRQKRRQEYRKNIRKQTARASRNMRFGVVFLAIFVMLFSARIVQLLYGMAITDHRMYTEMAANTHTERYPIYATRGNIYSSDGTELAISTYTYTVGLTPSVFGPRSTSTWTQAEVEEEFCRILDVDVLEFRKDLLEYEDRAYLQVRRTISGDVSEELSQFLTEARVSGVRQDPNQARYYPMGDLASQIIGFANIREDNLSGVTGVESYYNAELSGEAGYVYQVVDNYNAQPLLGTAEVNVPATPGYNLQLTIQDDLQAFIQDKVKELARGMGATNGAEAIVMDPDTGAILAMSSEYNIDLNNPTAAPDWIADEDWQPNSNQEQLDYMTGQLWTNRAINYPHEVGSVIKPFVLSASLDEGVITSTTPVDDDFVFVEGWPYPISSYDGQSRGMLSPAEAIWDSRNPPFVRLAQSLGIDTFYDYIHALGLRDETGIDLPNEVTGLFHNDPIEIDMAVTSFGEQVTITPMQIVNDYAMLANGGTLMEPYVVQAYLDGEGNVVRETQATEVRRVFSEESTREVREIMVGVGRYGTAKRAYVPGLEGAFKTGTSSRDTDGDGTDDAYSLTALAILPAENPEYVIYASVYDVADNLGRGSQVLVREISDFLTNRDNLEPEYKAYDYNFIFQDRFPNSNLGNTVQAASAQVMNDSFWPIMADSLDEGEIVQSQYPSPGMNVGYNTRIWLSDQTNDLPEKRVLLPDFTNLTVEEALREAYRLNLNVAFNGANRAGVCTAMKVVDANLAGGSVAGDSVREWTLIELQFDGEDQPGPKVDDSLEPYYDNGTGGYYLP